MNFLQRLRKRKRPKMGLREPTQFRSQSHLAFVRRFECIVNNSDCSGRIEAAHVRSSGEGGTGLKPGDEWSVPLCAQHHYEQHQIGESRFELRYGLDLKRIAEGLAKRSPHVRRPNDEKEI